MSSTDTFIATLTQTPTDAAALLVNLNKLSANLGQIITVLGYSKTVDDDLDQLDDALTTTMEALDIVTIIPEVGEAAAELKNAVSLLSEEVKPARNAADKIEAEVKPLRDALQNVQTKLGQFIDAVQKVQSASQTFLTDFTTVVQCINSLPDGTYKTQGLSYLDQFSSAAQPEVAGLNTALETANSIIGDFYSALDALQQALSPLQAISSAIEQVMSVLSPVTDLLTQLENDLQNIKIKLPIPYPLEFSLYDVFKDFSAFIDLAMAPIQDLVNQLLSALDIQLPQIPGLSDLINLNINIPDIPDFTGLLTAITNFFDQFAITIPTFSLACPPSSSDAEVPGGGNYSR